MSFRLSNPRRADSSPASRLEWMHELANWYGCVPVIFASIAESRRWRHPVMPFHVEHVIAKQHGGTDDPRGLALACDRCNAFKGPNLTSIDTDTNTLVPLFNPRLDDWNDHFLARGGVLIGRTPTGRATVRLLQMKARRRVELREEWRTHRESP
jgi:hypothetical protein